MSMLFISSNAVSADRRARRHLHGALGLARYTAQRRHELGLTVAQAAELAGIQISEWCGLEEGWVPDDPGTLRAVAGVLEVRWLDYHMLAFLSRCYQQCC